MDKNKNDETAALGAGIQENSGVNLVIKFGLAPG
jgi:hypothetical protein